jgi:alginate O-acetyltransferase complex protein AlgI
MLFCSEKFLFFFAAVFVVYWALPWRRLRVYLLLASSIYFYATWNQWLAGLIVATTTMDYGIARLIEATQKPRWRGACLFASVVINLSVLAYFKYANFFLQSLERALHAAGLSASMPALSVILPIGISFYTFEAINYTVDVYRGRTKAERNLANLMVFILFFPHLVAGPIVRARDFLPQVGRPKHWDWPRLLLGCQFFLVGLFKKMAIADRLAMAVDPVFAEPRAFSTGAVWLATLAYAVQIYCDFSGYSDMAIGCAHMLGYKLAQNFNMPYVSLNVSEFWKRWHMSLSSWLRDYLYIPLGGSRCSSRRTNFNLMATMALGGLWHGANWTFIAWGVLHGLFLVIQRTFAAFAGKRPRLVSSLETSAGKFLRGSITFLCVSAGWILFRAPSLRAAASTFYRLVVPCSGFRTVVPTYTIWTLFAIVALAHVLGMPGRARRLGARLPVPIIGLSYATILIFALLLAPMSNKAFIYFQF